jgi:multicomponent Na+:H+ antiporter subunit D
MISSLLNVAYLMPVVVRGFFDAPEGSGPFRVKEAPMFCVVPLCITAAGCLLLFFLADGMYRLLEPIAWP